MHHEREARACGPRDLALLCSAVVAVMSVPPQSLIRADKDGATPGPTGSLPDAAAVASGMFQEVWGQAG